MRGVRIEAGDMVEVHWPETNHPMEQRLVMLRSVEVIHVPAATGDSWIFRADSGDIYHVSEPVTVIWRKRA